MVRRQQENSLLNTSTTFRQLYSPRQQSIEIMILFSDVCTQVPVLVFVLQYVVENLSSLKRGRLRSLTSCTGSLSFHRYTRSSVVHPSEKSNQVSLFILGCRILELDLRILEHHSSPMILEQYAWILEHHSSPMILEHHPRISLYAKLLTTSNPHLALLPVQRVEFQIHRTCQSQGDSETKDFCL